MLRKMKYFIPDQAITFDISTFCIYSRVGSCEMRDGLMELNPQVELLLRCFCGLTPMFTEFSSVIP